MRLKPVIASYSGETYARIRRYLDDDVLQVIAKVAHMPREIGEMDQDVRVELVEMHVLADREGRVVLDTSVFVREDIERILEAVTPLARELAERVLESGSAFKGARPEVTLFLAGILGLVQGLGRAAQIKHVGVDWKSYSGKYAQSKVDFDEQCEVLERLGPDYLNKTVLRGERHTAVFIGPGGASFPSFIQPVEAYPASEPYARCVNRYLVDAYAALIKGEIQNQALACAAEAAALFRQGRSRTSVITAETMYRYGPAVETIVDLAASYYAGQLDALDALLRATTPGRQGVPPANMMLNLWRYVRKATAQALYANGFFKEPLTQEKSLTVFYENDVERIEQLFS